MFIKVSCRENQNMHFKFYNVFKKNLAIFEIKLKNDRAVQATDDNIIQHVFGTLNN